jgi:hypothetical protein
MRLDLDAIEQRARDAVALVVDKKLSDRDYWEIRHKHLAPLADAVLALVERVRELERKERQVSQ